jgi:acetyl esterase/lipase
LKPPGTSFKERTVPNPQKNLDEIRNLLYDVPAINYNVFRAGCDSPPAVKGAFVSTSPRAEVSSVEPVRFRYRRYSPDERRQSQSRPTILFIKGDGGFFFFALI